MAKKDKPKRRNFRKWIKRKRIKPKVPLEVLIAAGTIPFQPAVTGWDTLAGCVGRGDWTGLTNSLKMGFLGLNEGNEFLLGRLLNPFDMDVGRFSKMLIIAGIVGSVRSKFTGRYTTPLFNKIPFIGRWIK